MKLLTTNRTTLDLSSHMEWSLSSFYLCCQIMEFGPKTKKVGGFTHYYLFATTVQTPFCKSASLSSTER